MTVIIFLLRAIFMELGGSSLNSFMVFFELIIIFELREAGLKGPHTN